MSDLHPIAVELAAADKALAKHRATLAALKAVRSQLRQELSAAIRQTIVDVPTATNVDLAAYFGLRSETSIRNIRHAMTQTGATSE